MPKTTLERGAQPNGDMVEQKRLICVNPSGNNNKYIVVKLFDSGDVHRAWGRVRADGDGQLVIHETASGTEFIAGRDRFERYVRSKTKPGLAKDKRYSIVDALDSPKGASQQSVSTSNIKQVARDQIDHGCPVTKKLVEYLADVNVHQIVAGTSLRFNSTTGLFSTPLGIVTPDSVKQARRKLDTLGDCIANLDWDSNLFDTALEAYLRLVPHDVGHKLNVKKLLPNLQAVQKENDILDALDAAYIQATTQPVQKDKKAAAAPKVFSVKLTVVTDTQTTRSISQLFHKTRNRMHDSYGLRIHQVFAIDIETMRAAFARDGQRVGHIMRLWHGTKPSNLLSILKGGLIIPPKASSHCTGRLFGNGLYFSDQSTKSLNYAMGTAPGQSRSSFKRYFMFLADVAMGRAYKPSGSCSRPSQGCDSVHAMPGIDMGWGRLRNPEMIVYRTSQANLVLLVEFRQ